MPIRTSRHISVIPWSVVCECNQRRVLMRVCGVATCHLRIGLERDVKEEECGAAGDRAQSAIRSVRATTHPHDAAPAAAPAHSPPPTWSRMAATVRHVAAACGCRRRPWMRTGALTLIPCRYLGGRVPSEPFLETYLKRPNPRSFFSSHQGVML